MSNAIRLLESLGQHGPVSQVELAAAVAALELAPEVREALLQRDCERLPQLLGARASMRLILAPPDEAPAEGEEPAREEPDQKPDAMRRLAHVA